MALTKQTKAISLTLLLSFSPLSSGVLPAILEGSVPDMIQGVDIDSLVGVECKSFNVDTTKIDFSIAGCDLSIDLDKCFGQTLSSIKDIFAISGKNFDEDSACKQYILPMYPFPQSSKIKDPYGYKSIVSVPKLPKTLSDAEKQVSQTSDKIISSAKQMPKNPLDSKKRLSEEVVKKCALSSSRESCVLSNSLAFSKKEAEGYNNQTKISAKSFNENAFIAISNKEDLVLTDNTIAQKIISEKKQDFILSSLNKSNREATNKYFIDSISLVEKSVVEQYENVIARSIQLNYRPASQSYAITTIEPLELP